MATSLRYLGIFDQGCRRIATVAVGCLPQFDRRPNTLRLSPANDPPSRTDSKTRSLTAYFLPARFGIGWRRNGLIRSGRELPPIRGVRQRLRAYDRMNVFALIYIDSMGVIGADRSAGPRCVVSITNTIGAFLHCDSLSRVWASDS